MNKKQLLITLITATIISSQPVHAGDKTSRGFYIGGFGGGGTSDNDNISQSGAAYKRDEANAIHGYLVPERKLGFLIESEPDQLHIR